MAPKSRSTKTVSSLALLALATLAAAADEPKDAPKAGVRVKVDKERVKCLSERTACEDGSKTRVVVEQDVSVKIEIKAKPTSACAATVEIDYHQRDIFAHVTGAIENTTCAASGGDYILAVTLNDARGEPTTLEFPQEWARTDAEPVKFTYDLPIGPNVDLKNVRTRRLRCTCTETAEKP